MLHHETTSFFIGMLARGAHGYIALHLLSSASSATGAFVGGKVAPGKYVSISVDASGNNRDETDSSPLMREDPEAQYDYYDKGGYDYSYYSSYGDYQDNSSGLGASEDCKYVELPGGVAQVEGGPVSGGGSDKCPLECCEKACSDNVDCQSFSHTMKWNGGMCYLKDKQLDSTTPVDSTSPFKSYYKVCGPPPECDVKNGAGVSSKYPCTCGASTCTKDEKCSAETSTCKGIEYFGTGKAHTKEFWENMRGMGFSPADHRCAASFACSGDHLHGEKWPNKAAKPSVERLDDALQKLVDDGYNMIRFWRTHAYQELTLKRIHEKKLNITVQISIDADDLCRDCGCDRDCQLDIDAAVAIANKYPHLILGISVGNENMASWRHHKAATILKRAEYVKKAYKNLPVTYNFVDKENREHQNKDDLNKLIKSLDYVNMHMYGHPLYSTSSCDVDEHFQSVLEDERAAYKLVPDTKPIIIGETGWQLGIKSGRTCRDYEHDPTHAKLQEYYSRITKYIYGTPLAKRKAVSMFFFEQADETWKGGDNNWGIYFEGDAKGLGKAKIPMTKVDDILASTLGSDN